MLITSAIIVSTDEDSNVKEFFYNGLEKTFKEKLSDDEEVKCMLDYFRAKNVADNIENSFNNFGGGYIDKEYLYKTTKDAEAKCRKSIFSSPLGLTIIVILILVIGSMMLFKFCKREG